MKFIKLYANEDDQPKILRFSLLPTAST